MIKDNRIEFGYGDVAVGSCCMGYITFTNIKPPQEVGKDLLDEDNIEYGHSIRIFEDTAYELLHLVKTVSDNNRIIEYKGYILDFSNFNQKSLDVVLHNAKNMVNTMILAC